MIDNDLLHRRECHKMLLAHLKLQFPTAIIMTEIWDAAVGMEYIATLDAPKSILWHPRRCKLTSRYLSSFIHPIKKQRYWFTRLTSHR